MNIHSQYLESLKTRRLLYEFNAPSGSGELRSLKISAGFSSFAGIRSNCWRRIRELGVFAEKLGDVEPASLFLFHNLQPSFDSLQSAQDQW